METEENLGVSLLVEEIKCHLEEKRYQKVDAFLEKSELNHFSMVSAVLQVTKPYASILKKRKAFLLKAKSLFEGRVSETLLEGLE